jgi:hypothetical protein
MQLVRATETFAPQSPNKFTPNGSHLMNKKRKKICLKKENVHDNVQILGGTDEKKYPKKVKIIDEILAAEKLNIEDESDMERDRDRDLLCVPNKITVSISISANRCGTHLDGDGNIDHSNTYNDNYNSNNNDDNVVLERGESLLSRTSSDDYKRSHDKINSKRSVADSERDEIGDCSDYNDGNTSDSLSISSLAKTVSIEDMGLDPGYFVAYPTVSNENIAECPISIASYCSLSKVGSKSPPHAYTAHSEVMSLQWRDAGTYTVAGTGTGTGTVVAQRLTGVKVQEDSGSTLGGRDTITYEKTSMCLHERQETMGVDVYKDGEGDDDGECEEEEDESETACNALSLSLPVKEADIDPLRKQAACKAQVYLAVSKCFRELSRLYSELPSATHTFPPFSQVQMLSNALSSPPLGTAQQGLKPPLLSSVCPHPSLPPSASASSSSSSDSSPSTNSSDITTHYCHEEEPLPLPLLRTEECALSDKENRQDLAENLCYSNSQLPLHMSAFEADNVDKGPKHPGFKGSGSPARFSDPRKKISKSHPSPYITPKDLPVGSGISGTVVTNKSPLGVGPSPSLCPSRSLLESSCSVALEELEQWFLKWGNVLK